MSEQPNADLLKLQSYLDRCWESYCYYKDEQNKLLYWLGTVFVAVIAATGVLGAFKAGDVHSSFTFVHVIVFHVLFLIVWIFYLYKKLNAEMFQRLGNETELLIKRKFPSTASEKITPFFEIKGHYIGDLDLTGRGFSRYANVLIMLLYLGVVTYPTINGNPIRGEGLTINWESLLALLLFVALAGAGQLLYMRAKKEVIAKITKKVEESGAP